MSSDQPDRPPTGTDAESAAQRVFGADSASVRLALGEVLLREGEVNRRLYLVRSGCLRGDSRGSEGTIDFGPGDLIGVPSVFSGQERASLTVTAVEPSTLAWIEREPCAVSDPGCLEAAIMPLVVAELVRRQGALRRLVAQERELQERLRGLDRISALGQLAAGVAHELNNALAVIARGGAWLRAGLPDLIATGDELGRAVFDHGLRLGRSQSSAEVRRQAALLSDRLGLAEARGLVQMGLDAELRDRVLASGRLSDLTTRWELGATLHDLSAAATQAGDVVHSMRELAGSGTLRHQSVEVEETVRIALSLLRSQLQGLVVVVEATPVPTLTADHGGLVQMWANLIKNAAEAVQGASGGRIAIHVRPDDDGVAVSVQDNGPGIPDDLRPQVFDPHVTTKKSGLQFGLGLGLTIVQRLVLAHGGRIALDSRPGCTTFTVHLPTGAPA